MDLPSWMWHEIKNVERKILIADCVEKCGADSVEKPGAAFVEFYCRNIVSVFSVESMCRYLLLKSCVEFYCTILL